MAEISTQTSLTMHPQMLHRNKCDSAVDTLISFLRGLSHFWFTHVILILLLGGYTLGGAYLFHYVEAGHHEEMIAQIVKIRNKIMNELWIKCQTENVTKSSWIKAFQTKMCGYHNQLRIENVWLDEALNDSSWSLYRSAFYCGTVFTATGYGNIVTTTQTGQILTIVYSVIGIPYTLTVLLDIGSILTSVLRRAYIGMYKLYYFGFCLWKGTLPVNIYTQRGTPDNCTIASTSTYTDEEQRDKLFLMTGLKRSDFVIPVWIGFALILIYTFLGGLIFFHYESWTYTESLYFIIVSLTTIGFGDYVPKHTSYALAFSYILVGLALVSLFFNLIVERISKAMRKARRKIKERLRKDNTNNGRQDDLSELTTAIEDNVSSDEKGNGKIQRSVITVHFLDTCIENRQYRRSSPQIKTTPTVLLNISDSNLLKFIQFDRKGKKSLNKERAYISDKNFLKYLKDKMERKKKCQLKYL